jgi:hypothetical protein
MTTGNSSSSHANLLVALTLPSVRTNDVFLPLLDAVNHLISKSIADYNESQEEETEEEENARYFYGIAGTGADEGDEDEDEDEAEDDGEDGEDEHDDDKEEPISPKYRLGGYSMGYQEFCLLTERLPRVVVGYIVKYELFDGYLFVRTCPSEPHERTAKAVSREVIDWQRDPNCPGRQGDTLSSIGGAGKPPVLFRTFLPTFDRLPIWERKGQAARFVIRSQGTRHTPRTPQTEFSVYPISPWVAISNVRV